MKNKTNYITYIFISILILVGIFTFIFNYSIRFRINKEREDKIVAVHNETVEKLNNSLNNFATLICAIKAHIENEKEFPNQEELQHFVLDMLQELDYKDSIIISYIDTAHIFRYSFTRTKFDKGQLVGKCVVDFRDTAHIEQLNKTMNDSCLHLFSPMNLIEGWPGLPFVFGVYQNNKSIGYMAPILDINTLMSHIYQNKKTVSEFAFKFKVANGAEFDQTAVFDGYNIYNKNTDTENYKNFNINESDFIYSTIEKYDLKIIVGTAYKKAPKNIFIIQISSWFSYIIFCLLMILILRNNLRTKKLNNSLQETNNIIKNQKNNLILKNQTLAETYKELKNAKKNISYTNEQLKSLNRINQKIINSLDSKTIIKTVYKHINQLMDAEGFGIGLYDKNKKNIRFDYYVEKKKVLPYAEISLSKKDDLAIYCFNNQEIIVINDYQKEVSKFIDITKTKTFYGEIPQSLLYTPLYTDRKIGVMTVQSFKKNSYTEHHIEILKNIAVFAAIALDKAEAYQNIEKQKENIVNQKEELFSLVEELKRKTNIIEKTNIELKRLSIVASKTDNYVLIVNVNDKIEWVNKGFTKITGFSENEAIGNMPSMVVGGKETELDIIDCIDDAIFNNKISYKGEITNYKKDGSTFRTEIEVSPILDSNKNLEGYFVIGRDISEKIKYEKALKEQRDIAVIQKNELAILVYKLKKSEKLIINKNEELTKLSLVVDKTDNAVMIIDKTGKIEWVNRGFVKLYGYTFEEFTQNKDNIFDCNTNDYSNNFIKEAISNKKTVTYEVELKHKNGSKLWIQTTWTPILDEKDEIISLIAIDSDITKMKKAEYEIKEQQKSIRESISYARYIQKALLPSQNYLDSLFSNFIFNKPKDIVSGDFYFAQQINQYTIISVADCTGHGVPGGFLTMLGITILNSIQKFEGENATGDVLDLLRNKIKQIFKNSDSKDGMDMTICGINKNKNELLFSGAFNSIYIVKNKQLTEYKGTKNSVGRNYKDKNFKTHKIKIEKEDMIYMFTDGFPDQFGGKNDEKFRYVKLKKLLISISQKTMQEQKELIENAFDNWKGNREQIDDVLVMGIKI